MSTERREIILAEDSHLGKRGEKRLLTLTPTDTRTPEELSNYLAGYKNDNWRSDEVSPPVLVDNDTDLYRTFSSDDAFEPVKVKTALIAKPNLIDVRSSTAQYRVGYRAIGSLLLRPTENQSNYPIKMALLRRIQRVIRMDREIDVIVQATTIGNFAAAQAAALGAGYNWNGGLNSDPIANLGARIDASFQDTDYIHMNLKTMRVMTSHPAFTSYMRTWYGDSPPAIGGSIDGQPNYDFKVIGFPPFKIHTARYKDPADGVVKVIWPDGVVFFQAAPPGQPMSGDSIATLKTFRTKGPAGVGYAVREYIVEETVEPATMLVGWSADVSVVTANNGGGIVTGAYT